MIQTGEGSSQNQSALELGPWPAGMNNLQAPYSLPEGTTADAINGDFDNQGRFSRRAGFERVDVARRAHSAFSSAQGVFLVDGHELIRWAPDSREVLAQVSGEPMSFVEYDDVVYWTDSVETGRIVDGVVSRWGVAAPDDSFWVSADDTDSTQGEVTVALTFRRADGVESGLGPAKQVRAALDAVVEVGDIPAATDPDVDAVNVYAGRGEALYLEASLPVGTRSTSLPMRGAGRPAEQRQLVPPPAGTDLITFKGRILIVDGLYLWYTDPFRPEHVDPAKGWIAFEQGIEVVAPVEDGIYVAAGSTTYFRGTDPDKFVAQTVLNYGAVPGTYVRVPNTPQAMWMTARGAVIADREGRIANLQESHVDPGVAPERGAAMIRESQGLRQFIAVAPAADRSRARR